jgi:uncharacterized membrane protein
MPTERVMPVGVFVLVAPAIAGALGHVPAVGTQLGGVFGALAVLAAASLATGIALMLFNRTKDDLASLSK